MTAKASNTFREELGPMIAMAHYQALYQGALLALKINPPISELQEMSALTESISEAIATIMLAANWPDKTTTIEGMLTYLQQRRRK
jgi:hypothetical protein